MELAVAGLVQGDAAMNCGPTAAAILLGSASSTYDEMTLRQLRDRIGRWSWTAFPMRRVRWPGREPGMTLPYMMKASLQRFGVGRVSAVVSHGFLPREALAFASLHRVLSRRQAALLLVESPVLWGTASPGLHWIVVTGYDAGEFIYIDPSDGKAARIASDRLWWAWRLNPLWRGLLKMTPFTGFAMAGVSPPRALIASVATGEEDAAR